jgi:hypothetical protein
MIYLSKKALISLTGQTNMSGFCTNFVLKRMCLILYEVCSLFKDFRYLNFCWPKTVKIFSPKKYKNFERINALKKIIHTLNDGRTFVLVATV